MPRHTRTAAAVLTSLAASAALAATPGGQCRAQSGATVTPVLELYTSEGCSSCPPADRYLSGLRERAASGHAVVEAFHVGYWDYIGWVDRFATPAHTSRQRQVSGWNNLRSIYTPQLVLNGADWRPGGLFGVGGNGDPLAAGSTAHASIALRQLSPDQWEAQVTPDAGAPARWSAYWTVTEHGHTSRVSAGENNGETLKHDFVVRQYVPAGDYASDTGRARTLNVRSIAATPGHERQVNLVVFDPANGKTVQALSVGC